VRAKHFDQPLVLPAVLLETLQLEARGAECTGGGMFQAADGGGTLTADIDEVLGQGADDAVTAGVDLVDVPRAQRRLDHPAGGGIDDRGDAARLGVKGIFLG
jgi:hypothetical protein